jgi:hypothetical protein
MTSVDKPATTTEAKQQINMYNDDIDGLHVVRKMDGIPPVSSNPSNNAMLSSKKAAHVKVRKLGGFTVVEDLDWLHHSTIIRIENHWYHSMFPPWLKIMILIFILTVKLWANIVSRSTQ